MTGVADGDWGIAGMGRGAWRRSVRVDSGHSLTIAVWPAHHDGWEWEILDEDHDRHLAGGQSGTARAALDAVLAAAQETWGSRP